MRIVPDPAIFPIREKGQLVAFFFPSKKFSNTGIDKKIIQTPTRESLTSQQKRHFVRSALSNGGKGVIELMFLGDSDKSLAVVYLG